MIQNILHWDHRPFRNFIFDFSDWAWYNDLRIGRNKLSDKSKFIKLFINNSIIAKMEVKLICKKSKITTIKVATRRNFYKGVALWKTHL